jgi:DNA-binding CsgD family transcriptional regulator
MATAASNALWDDDGLRAVCRRHIRLAREVGALEALPIPLIALASATARSGDLAAASSLVAEARAVVQVTGTRLAPYSAEMLLASLRGREAELAALTRTAVEQAPGAGQGIVATVAAWAAAILLNGLGRYEEALEAARRAGSAAGDQFAAMWSSAELVEAAVRAGEPDLARAALERLAETTRPAGTDFGLGIEARSRALVTDGDGAEPLHRAAIERLGRTQMRSELARAHLLYGEWLRRAGRRRLAREQLRTAHGLFVAMGMAAFAKRAGRELRATGETVRRRAAETRDALTPQERQVADLAAGGLSNPEIGERLFLSPRTVEWHLKNVFAKLGIASRRGLAEALATADADVPAA